MRKPVREVEKGNKKGGRESERGGTLLQPLRLGGRRTAAAAATALHLLALANARGREQSTSSGRPMASLKRQRRARREARNRERSRTSDGSRRRKKKDEKTLDSGIAVKKSFFFLLFYKTTLLGKNKTRPALKFRLPREERVLFWPSSVEHKRHQKSEAAASEAAAGAAVSFEER